MSDWEEIKFTAQCGITPNEPNKVHVVTEESPLYGIMKDWTEQDFINAGFTKSEINGQF